MVFSIFELRLIDDRDKVESVAISCINSKKETVLYLRTSALEEMITKFVVSAILHHVDMSWIICSNKEMKYETDESNHQYWLNQVTCYNTSIC